MHALAAPVAFYPLYENATRAACSKSLEYAQFESAEIWSPFSEVAAANDGAWIRKPASPADILRIDERNRPIAFPYSKLMVANSSVNQGAGFVVASLAEARRRGIAEDRSEEHTSELQSLMRISYAVLCLKKKKDTNTHAAQ